MLNVGAGGDGHIIQFASLLATGGKCCISLFACIAREVNGTRIFNSTMYDCALALQRVFGKQSIAAPLPTKFSHMHMLSYFTPQA